MTMALAASIQSPTGTSFKNNAGWLLNMFFTPAWRGNAETTGHPVSQRGRKPQAIARSEPTLHSDLPAHLPATCEEIAVLRAFLSEDIRAIIEGDGHDTAE